MERDNQEYSLHATVMKTHNNKTYRAFSHQTANVRQRSRSPCLPRKRSKAADSMTSHENS